MLFTYIFPLYFETWGDGVERCWVAGGGGGGGEWGGSAFLECQRSDSERVSGLLPVCTAGRHSAQTCSEIRPLPVCQQTAACKGWGVGVSLKSQWKITNREGAAIMGGGMFGCCFVDSEWLSSSGIQNFHFFSWLDEFLPFSSECKIWAADAIYSLLSPRPICHLVPSILCKLTTDIFL